MSLIETAPAGLFQEIIKLQLKKPKNWNWQLSTSKSSPHIALPIIQLYNSKGQLVLEAKDSGATQRRSWHSSDAPKETTANVKRENKEPTQRHLQRCRSDTLETERRNRSANKLDSIKRREIQRSTNNKLSKSSSAVLDNSISRKGADATNENRKSRSYNENSIKGEDGGCGGRGMHDLKKSRSDVIELKGNPRFAETSKRNPLRPITSVVDIVENKEKNDVIQSHRRCKSDDLFRRKLKYNEESLKRAEIDGYRKFVTPATLQNALLANNPANIEHNRYKTRTSSAGTLIITNESFNNRHRRRRRRDASIENSNNAQNNAALKKDTSEGTTLHVRQGGDPANLETTLCEMEQQQENRYSSTAEHNNIDATPKTRFHENKASRKNGSAPAGLFYSRSDIFPFEKTLNNRVDEKHDDKCNYIVHDPVVLDGDNKNRKNARAIIEKLERKKRKKVRRHYSDASTSPSREKKYQHKRKGNGTKGKGNWLSIDRDY